jgi:predicted TIM-barrel fold metal-dependent hydrolase
MDKRNKHALGILLGGSCIIGAIIGLSLAVSPREAPAEPAPAGDATVYQPTRIIDVHEHIKALKNAPTLLAAMDDMKIEKTLLMGSSIFTLTLKEDLGFSLCDENNEELLRICQQYPGRFEAWPTMDPRDPQKLDKFKDYVKRGATGLKLYLGHGYVTRKTGEFMFHPVAMDDPGMLPVYAYCAENFIPVCLHVNPSPKATPGFAEEFVAVLEQFPDLKLVCPHFMLSSIADNRLRELLETFPNLYTDVSFGNDKFLIEGLNRISKSPKKFRGIFAKYPGRFMFAADLVVTDETVKTREWIRDRFQAYVDMLTKETYTTSAIPGVELNGCHLPPDIVDRILYRNYLDFAASKPKGTVLNKKLDWGRMGFQPVRRMPGEAAKPIKE